MKMIIHDLKPEQEERLFSAKEDLLTVSAKETIKTCIGCFGCWLKTPGRCVLKDQYQEMGRDLSLCGELIIISRCVYGSFSPMVKSVMDRCIPYLHPCFTIRGGEMHHRRRYDNRLKISAFFYGEDLTEKERETAEHIVRANCVNLDGDMGRIAFLKKGEALEGEWI
ncbi:flavodoxin family protein [Anaerovorax odorimutans]|uniref:Flavodoxin family protein n=1 Tax=Anaerovorax odorimutans TaxID=109327 RepID=A0ABT1RN90_9FIRM|nr:flavodoxin family protein [Anaerovorax odorimutans]MCQ4636655.1 flavodoxin family protein [Anaerovorax odorimutans]